LHNYCRQDDCFSGCSCSQATKFALTAKNDVEVVIVRARHVKQLITAPGAVMNHGEIRTVLDSNRDCAVAISHEQAK